ncbi:TetR/AcrR family transcriptional regulator [Brevibacillus sp. NRS-1366]|uniref:TetR/AcrR family transcriptional regulator n=1 Tax=Brevibacillus sp. NRS-1366 TaxID=3233899 RepID=UPI003D24EA6E
METNEKLEHMSTRDKIIYVAINLMAKSGYKSVTIKEIAKHASVSEMTVFRHFGTKKQIMEYAIDHFYYTAPMKKIFNENIEWDLEKDLLLVSKSYHELMNRNVKVISIAFKEGNTIPGLLDQINKHPRQLKEFLVDYFSKMQELGKIIPSDPETYAMIFLYLSYGEFVSRSFVAGHMITSIPQEEIIKTSVRLFVKSLTPQSIS